MNCSPARKRFAMLTQSWTIQMCKGNALKVKPQLVLGLLNPLRPPTHPVPYSPNPAPISKHFLLRRKELLQRCIRNVWTSSYQPLSLVKSHYESLVGQESRWWRGNVRRWELLHCPRIWTSPYCRLGFRYWQTHNVPHWFK